MPYRPLKPADGVTDLILRGRFSIDNEDEKISHFNFGKDNIFNSRFQTSWSKSICRAIVDAKSNGEDINSIYLNNIRCQPGVF